MELPPNINYDFQSLSPVAEDTAIALLKVRYNLDLGNRYFLTGNSLRLFAEAVANELDYLTLQLEIYWTYIHIDFIYADEYVNKEMFWQEWYDYFNRFKVDNIELDDVKQWKMGLEYSDNIELPKEVNHYLLESYTAINLLEEFDIANKCKTICKKIKRLIDHQPIAALYIFDDESSHMYYIELPVLDDYHHTDIVAYAKQQCGLTGSTETARNRQEELKKNIIETANKYLTAIKEEYKSEYKNFWKELLDTKILERFTNGNKRKSEYPFDIILFLNIIGVIKDIFRETQQGLVLIARPNATNTNALRRSTGSDHLKEHESIVKSCYEKTLGKIK